jgi:hypothetical protein
VRRAVEVDDKFADAATSGQQGAARCWGCSGGLEVNHKCVGQGEKDNNSIEGNSGLKRGWYNKYGRAFTTTILRVVTTVFGQS